MSAQVVTAGAPVRGVICLTTTGRLLAETGRAIDEHSRQSTPQGNLMLLLDTYQT